MVRKKLTPIEKELQRTREDLEDLEMFITEFTAFLPLAICTLNPIRIIIDINKAFEAMTSYKSIEIIGEEIYKILPEKEELDRILKKARTGKVAKSETALTTKEAKKIPVNISISIRKDAEGNFIGYFIGIIDITESKEFQTKMEEKVKERTKELEESRAALINMLGDVEESRKALTNILEDVEEERKKAEEERDKTQTIITNLADGLVAFDGEGNLSLINPQAEDFFDVKSRDIIGRSILELSTFPTLATLASLLGREIKGVFRKELPIRENLTLEVSTIPMVSGEEKLGNLVILHDIAREKMIERMKTEFVSLAAHQLRTPLSAIKWTLRMLLDGDLGKITEEQREFIEKTYSSNERMIHLINDLLNVARIEEGKYLNKPTLASIESVIQFVVDLYKEEMEKRKLTLEFKKPKEKLPKVILDVEKMRLGIQNFLDNAIRYTRPGGKVTISISCGKKEVEVAIRDTGVGIPEDQKARVFSKFFRGTNVIRMETEGTGLGLFITKNIIETHGGRVWFESKENEGTTFYFVLPLSNPRI